MLASRPPAWLPKSLSLGRVKPSIISVPNSASLRNPQPRPLMPRRNIDHDPFQIVNKRRRISASSTPRQAALEMTQLEESLGQPVPKLELTLVENAIKSLL